MIDLTRSRAATEAEMVDECTITRDPQGVHDDVFDEATLTYQAPAASDSTQVYAGPCMVVAMSTRAQGQLSEGGQDVFRQEYRLRIPVVDEHGNDVIPLIGDTITVTDSLNDPAMVDREFTAIEVLGGTSTVSRRIRMTSRTRGPRT